MPVFHIKIDFFQQLISDSFRFSTFIFKFTLLTILATYVTQYSIVEAYLLLPRSLFEFYLELKLVSPCPLFEFYFKTKAYFSLSSFGILLQN